MVWSFILAVVGILGLWVAGSNRWYGWAIGLGAQLLWVIYALVSNQYGFLLSAFGYGFVYARNIITARKRERTSQKAISKI